MAIRQFLSCVLLAACLAVLHAKPDTSDEIVPACDPAIWIQCMQPIIFLGFSGAGGRNLAELGQNLTPAFYNNLCSMTGNFTTCARDYTKRCDLAMTGNVGTPATQSKVQFVTRAMSHLVSSCDDADGFTRFKKTVTCAAKAEPARGTCWTAAQAHFPEDERETSPTHVFSIKNPQKNVCCMINQFKTCIAPTIQSACSADEKGAANGLMDKILEGFECTDTVYQTCSS